MGFKDLIEVSAGRKADMLILAAHLRPSLNAIERIAVVIAQGRATDRPALLNWQIPRVNIKIESD